MFNQSSHYAVPGQMSDSADTMRLSNMAQEYLDVTSGVGGVRKPFTKAVTQPAEKPERCSLKLLVFIGIIIIFIHFMVYVGMEIFHAMTTAKASCSENVDTKVKSIQFQVIQSLWLQLENKSIMDQPLWSFCTSESCFKRTAEKMTWENARLYCQSTGGRLAEIYDNTVNDHVLQMANATQQSLWIGGTDQEKEGIWKWAESGNVFKYAAWARYRPNNYGGDEHCLEFSIAFALNWDGTWNDLTCSEEKMFLCEYFY